jgi:rhodanese-related sulfurtransferase
MESPGAVAPIAADDARAMLDRGEAVAVDVREPAEILATGRVPGAINIPLAEVVDRSAPDSPRRLTALSPEKAVILYCASGKRSQCAGERLVELGYRAVFNLGGFKDWVEAGHPVDADSE